VKYDPILFKDKLGRDVVLRSAEASDAADLIAYLKATAAETPYLLRDPEEIDISLEQEIGFIESKRDADKELLLVASIDGTHIGNCSLLSIAPFRRCAHRCEIGIALYQEYCGCGIGTNMLQALLAAAKRFGYEQAELEVISDNKRAIAMYRKLGFEKFGTMPGNLKYADGSYADADWMMKKL